MKKTFVLFIGFSFLFGIGMIGCNRPADLPKLVPCEIIVTDGGTPLSNVRVSMRDGSTTGSWSIHGTTDSSGAAKMSTTYANYTGPGVPFGKYKVAVDKEPDEKVAPPVITDDMTEEQADKIQKEWDEEYETKRIIPKELTFVSSTPFTVEVTGSGDKHKIDISEHKK